MSKDKAREMKREGKAQSESVRKREREKDVQPVPMVLETPSPFVEKTNKKEIVNGNPYSPSTSNNGNN